MTQVFHALFNDYKGTVILKHFHYLLVVCVCLYVLKAQNFCLLFTKHTMKRTKRKMYLHVNYVCSFEVLHLQYLTFLFCVHTQILEKIEKTLQKAAKTDTREMICEKIDESSTHEENGFSNVAYKEKDYIEEIAGNMSHVRYKYEEKRRRQHLIQSCFTILFLKKWNLCCVYRYFFYLLTDFLSAMNYGI